MFLFIFIAILLSNQLSFCQNNVNTDFKNYLLNFGAKRTTVIVTTAKDLHSELVDTLLKNADSVFGEWDDTETTTKNTLDYEISQQGQDLDLRNLKPTQVVFKQIKDNVRPFKDLEVPGFAARPQLNSTQTEKSHKMQERPFSPEPLFPMTGPQNKLIIKNPLIGSLSLAINSSMFSKLRTTKYRSCIFCNSFENSECNDPRNGRSAKVAECEDMDDVCYSQHTPFGVVNRGCYNTKKNLTTYVCACNLCNHISITDMPYIFKTKKDWVKNVIELSRLKYLTKSVFKDMRCLRCEVNGTSHLVSDGDVMDEVNCLSPSNIELMKTEQCREDFICGVITKASEHYVWRGCIEAPLYNYWLQICNTNLCNQDPIISIYP